VSPDERGFVSVIAAARRRAQRLLAGVVAGWSLTAAAAAAALGIVARWPLVATVVVTCIAGASVAAAIVVSRKTRITRRAVVQALERHQTSSRNLLVTAGELSRGELEAAPSVRTRVFAQAFALARAIDVTAVFPAARTYRMLAIASVAWLGVAAALAWRAGAVDVRMRIAGNPETARGVSGSPAHVTVTVQPPGYTGLAARTFVDPPQIEAVEGSIATVAMAGPVPRVLSSTRLTRTGYISVDDGAGERRTIPTVVIPDALPAPTITAPGRDLVYGGGNPRIAFEAHATDDFGLRSLSLQFTKASGSGEQFDFKEGEIPLSIARDGTRAWRGSASRSLADLNLKEGDVLVYRAVAADNRPGDGSASSDAFFIEVSKLGVAAGDAFTLPQEETRYALSQQMLIIKTERLNRQRASMPAIEVADAALNLAVEQRMIRAEFVFMLGGEVEDEEVEAQQSVELQEGRLQNRGQRDLRAATMAMSQAEKLLTGANLADALAAERAAVVALQRAFARDRYILRALGQRAVLDPTRRLTGDVSKAADWRRLPPDVPANRRAALLQDLLRGLADLSRTQRSQNGTPASASIEASEFRARARVLAEEAVRIDASSAALRQAATELQRAGDAGNEPARARPLAAAIAAATSEARRSLSPPPPRPASPGGSLDGAFADALARMPREATGKR
jgi:hypothetical protein